MPRRTLSLIGYAIVIVALLYGAHLVTVKGEVIACVNRQLHADHPNLDTADVWAVCKRLHMSFPASFFR